MNRAGGITVSPGTRDMVVVGISLGGAPRCGVSIDCGAAGVGDSHEVEGENAGRSGCRARYGRAVSSLWKRENCKENPIRIKK